MEKQLKLVKKIKELREKMNFSQEEFAKAMGLSRVAISQLENGKRGIDAFELMKIAEFFNISTDHLLREEEISDKYKTEKEEQAERPIKFNSEKLKNTILYILERCGGKPNIGETVLYKLLYFIDFDNFELHGEPVTGMRYLKLQFGPVPRLKDYRETIDQMMIEGALEFIEKEYHGKKQKRYIALINADLSIFKGDEVKTMDDVITRLSDMNANMIEDYVHEDAPWELSEDRQEIPYNLVFERSMPYARRDHDSEFMQAGATDSISDLTPTTKKEHEYYMNL